MSTDKGYPLRFDTYSVITLQKDIFVSQAEVSECTKGKKNLPNITIFKFLKENIALVGTKPKFFSGVISSR